jgi:hypothetical protein
MAYNAMIQEASEEATPQAFSFSALESEISTHLPDNSDPDKDLQALISAIGMVVSYAGIQLINTFFPSKVPSWFTFLLVVIAIISMFWLLYATVKKELREIRDRHRISAIELDEQSEGFKKVVAWLRFFPATILEEKLDFIQKKMETIELRSAALFGNLERFGLLAVLVALYLQFKDATISWPPNITFSSLILSAAILSVYFGSAWTTSYKWQLNTYRQLLQMALKSAPQSSTR